MDSAGMYGAERVILTLLERLERSRFPCVLGCIREDGAPLPELARRALERGIPVECFSMGRGFSVRGMALIWGYVARRGTRLIHSHGYKTDMFLGFHARRDVRLVSTVHGWPGPGMGLKLRLYEALDRAALRRFDAVAAVSQGMGERLRSRIPGRGVVVIRNGIEIPEIPPSAPRGAMRTGRGADRAAVVGFLGRLAPVKGCAVLLEAMPAVLRQRDCELMVAGDGPLRRELEARAEALGIADRVRFLGYLTDVDGFLSQIDVLVMPSFSEGLPMSLLEAASRGVPILATSVGGIPEVVAHNVNGILVPPGDPTALSHALADLLCSPGLAGRLAAAGRSIVSAEFGAGRMTQSYENLYADLLTSSGREPGR